MKILLLLPASPSASPYLYYYLHLFDKNNVDYDVCIWNRSNDVIEDKNYFVFNSKKSNNKNLLSKVKVFGDYQEFIIKILKARQYDRIVVFTIQLAIYLSKVLVQKYKGKYIVDIRDYSKILKIPFAYNILSKILRNSALNCISSPGFRQWLPREAYYIVSHNVDFNILKCQSDICNQFTKPLRILTIGSIRDEASNELILSQLGNDYDYVLKFSGDGPAVPYLKSYSENHSIENVSFTGGYKKPDEMKIVKESDLINIVLPRNKVSDFLMSNRFYLSVIHRKPMIVNEGCYQAKVVKQYGLGVVINPAGNISEQIQTYIKEFNYKLYNEGCEAFIQEVLKNIDEIETKLEKIIAGK